MQMNLLHVFGHLFFFSIFACEVAFAVPSSMTFQSKIYKPDGTALVGSSVSFRFTTVDPTGTCVLYVEDFINQDLSNSAGLAIFNLGNGSKVYPTVTYSFSAVFNNLQSFFSCQGGGTYSPGVTRTDSRKIIMQFNDGSASGWQSLPALDINSVPFAAYASDSQKFGGLNVADFLRTSALPTCAGSDVLTYNGSILTCVSSSGGTVAAVSGTAPIMSSGGASPVISINDATTVAKGAVQVGTGLGVSVGTLSVNYGTTATTAAAGNDVRIAGAAQKTANLSDLGSAATARANLGLEAAASMNVGSVAGTLAAGDDVRFTAGLQAVNNLSDVGNIVSARNNLGLGLTNTLNIAQINSLLIYGGTAAGANLTLESTSDITKGKIILKGPLQITAGTPGAGKVLTSDATGNISWTAAATGSVTSAAVVTANGFSGSVATATTTPSITLSTTITGILNGNGTALSAAAASDFPLLNQNTSGTAATVTTNANLTGDVISVGNATTLGNAPVIAKVLTGFISAAGTIAATDSILGAFQKLDGNIAGKQASGNYISSLTGDITATGPGAAAATIGANKITNAMLSQVATQTFLGRTTAATGNVETLSAVQATAMFDVFTATTKGLAPASGGGTANFLRSDGTWAAPGGSGDMILASPQTVTGAKTYGAAGAVGKLIIAGATSGQTILDATAVAGAGTVILPVSGTLLTTTGSAAGLTSFPILNQNTTGTAANVTGVVAIANGGTSNALLPVTAGGVIYTDGTKLMNVGAGTAGQVLSSNTAGAPTWISAATGSVTSVSSATTDIGVSVTSPNPVLTLNSGVGPNQIVKLNLTSQLPAVDGNLLTNLNASALTSGTVPVVRGGTGNTSFANFSVIASNIAGNQIAVPGVTSNTMLQWTVTGPAWSTSTFPSSTTANQLLFSSANNIVGGLASANDAVLTTNATGVPSFVASLPAVKGGTGQSTYTVGDILYGAVGNTLAKLPAAASGLVLTSNGLGTAPSWTAPVAGGTVTSASVATANGFSGTVATPSTTPAITINTTVTGILKGNGTAISVAATSDFPILNQNTSGNAATATLAANVTTNANLTGDVISTGNATTLSNAPVIAKVLTGFISAAGTVAATDSILSAVQKLDGNIATKGSGDMLLGAAQTVSATKSFNAGTFILKGVTSGQTILDATAVAGSGTVILPVSGTLLTTTGSASGLTSFPVLNQNTTGTAANVTGVVAIANGGTGATTANAGLNALLPAQATNANKFLRTDGINTSWVLVNAGTVTNVTGTAPISVATGTTTPAISIATANTTTTGAINSVDWNTFNAKLSTANVSGTTNLIPKFTSANVIGNSSITDNGVTVSTTLNLSAATITASGSFSGPGTNLTGTAASLTAGAANGVAWTNVSGRPSTGLVSMVPWAGNAMSSAYSMPWRNYGDHQIVDLSAGLAPNGVAKSNTNPDVPWAATYPTLMGWNGASTYGVRVDSARFADGTPFTGVTGKPTTLAGYGITDNVVKGGTPGDWDIASSGNNSSYTFAAFEIRELNFGGGQTGAASEAPRISFHWGGRVASQIGMDNAGVIRTYNNPGTGYENFAALNVTANGNVTATSFISTSDRRLKKDIRVAPGISEISKITGYQYNWKADGTADAGVIAQELEDVFPDAVRTDAKTGFKAVKYQYLIAPLINATNEVYRMCKQNTEDFRRIDRSVASLQDENITLKKQVLEMKQQLEKQSADVEAIKTKLGIR